MPQPIGIKALPRLVGVSPAAVRKAQRVGYLTADASGRFDLDNPGVRWWVRWHMAGYHSRGCPLPGRDWSEPDRSLSFPLGELAHLPAPDRRQAVGISDEYLELVLAGDAVPKPVAERLQAFVEAADGSP